MSKLGMPDVIMSFEEAGIAAVERSKRGIAALILEDDSTQVAKLTENPFLVYTTDDIPHDISADNRDYILKCLTGYVRTPYRILVYVQNKTESNESTKFDDTLAKLSTDRFDYLAIPTIATEQLETLAVWVKSNRENKHKKVKVVLPGYDADYEGVVNFSNKVIKTRTKTYTPAEYTARIAGLICGTPMQISATYAPLSEVIDCDKYTLDNNNDKVNRGEFFIWFDGEKFKLSRAMNSLVTTTQGKNEGYQTIKIVDAMDMIYDDVRKTAQDSYIGKYTNDYDNKILLITAIMGYFKKLEEERILQKGFSQVEIDVNAVRIYQLQNGLYTKEQLAKMTDTEIKMLDTRKKVFLKAKIKILDAMEDIVLPIAI